MLLCNPFFLTSPSSVLVHLCISLKPGCYLKMPRNSSVDCCQGLRILFLFITFEEETGGFFSFTLLAHYNSHQDLETTAHLLALNAYCCWHHFVANWFFESVPSMQVLEGFWFVRHLVDFRVRRLLAWLLLERLIVIHDANRYIWCISCHESCFWCRWILLRHC